MSQKLPVRKNTEHPTDALWWKPIFAMQKEMNDTFSNMITGFVPPSFWTAERNTFSMWQENVHRLFSEMFNTRQMITPWLNGGRTEPFIDIRDNEKSFIIRADVPGLDPENLDIAVSDSAVTIAGYKDDECRDGEAFVHHECCNGSFCRTVALPEEADTENARAAFEKNVLTIEVPKKPKSAQRSRKLEIIVANDKENAASTGKKKAA